jgi:hypothetical protein
MVDTAQDAIPRKHRSNPGRNRGIYAGDLHQISSLVNFDDQKR